MRLNADFSRRAVVHAAQLEWQDSPMSGVQRRMLDRVGGEVARATSIVRYQAGSRFSSHVHTGGEEFLVLDGVFQDEHGDYSAGSYIRNPPTSSHTPGSDLGCTIFVKLWQFDPQDRHHVQVASDSPELWKPESELGLSVLPLHQDESECVSLEKWGPLTARTMNAEGGAEVLVLEGGFEESNESFTAQSWLRVPVGGTIQATAGPFGAKVWVKTGHLRSLNLDRFAD